MKIILTTKDIWEPPETMSIEKFKNLLAETILQASWRAQHGKAAGGKVCLLPGGCVVFTMRLWPIHGLLLGYLLSLAPITVLKGVIDTVNIKAANILQPILPTTQSPNLYTGVLIYTICQKLITTAWWDKIRSEWKWAEANVGTTTGTLITLRYGMCCL